MARKEITFTINHKDNVYEFRAAILKTSQAKIGFEGGTDVNYLK